MKLQIEKELTTPFLLFYDKLYQYYFAVVLLFGLLSIDYVLSIINFVIVTFVV